MFTATLARAASVCLRGGIDELALEHHPLVRMCGRIERVGHPVRYDHSCLPACWSWRREAIRPVRATKQGSWRVMPSGQTVGRIEALDGPHAEQVMWCDRLFERSLHTMHVDSTLPPEGPLLREIAYMKEVTFWIRFRWEP